MVDHPLGTAYTIRVESQAMKSATPEPHHILQILVANEQHDRLEKITEIVEALGHEVVGRYTSVEHVGVLSRSVGADIALVGLGLDDEHALAQISQIVQEAACPVIALIDTDNPSYIEQAAQRGIFAYVVLNGKETDELHSAIDITLRRFAEFRNLQGAFGRRAIIEQAKGILMGRNTIDADAAFELLKTHSQKSGQKLADVAEMITQAHQLLPPAPELTHSNPGNASDGARPNP